MDLNQVTLPCTDYAASVDFYKKLGLRQIVDSPPRYARFETEQGTTLSIHAAAPGSSGAAVVVYFEVEDLHAAVKSLQDKGLYFDSGPKDESWLWSEARLSDPAGNSICIFNAGENRRFPPWRIDTQSS
tara:strand:- start:8930 stop:9316 length:387 start_codon:yes stop_codon:yes gene_type:complete